MSWRDPSRPLSRRPSHRRQGPTKLRGEPEFITRRGIHTRLSRLVIGSEVCDQAARRVANGSVAALGAGWSLSLISESSRKPSDAARRSVAVMIAPSPIDTVEVITIVLLLLAFVTAVKIW